MHASALRTLAILVLSTLPLCANAQPQPGDAAIQREWRDYQHEDRHVRRAWWRRLTPGQLARYIEAGSDVNAADRRGWTPLHSAARDSSNAEVLTMLLQAGAIVNARDRAGDTPLHWAAADNPNVDVLKALIASGASVNARDRFGWQPIHTAAERNPNPAILAALLEAGSRRNTRAYFILFRPEFLLRHNAGLSRRDKKYLLTLLRRPDS